MIETSFATRLETARRMVANERPPAGPRPAHWLDQLRAASAEARDQVLLTAHVVRIVEPERDWRHRDRDPGAEARSHMLAGLLDCMRSMCPHLRKGGPQPAYAMLPLRRLDCGRCTATRRVPPPEDDDRCDVCGARGIVRFTPFLVQAGPALIGGDACSTCASAMGLPDREVA
jgi:hypothetical protein